jgi:hypothetical protein
MGALSCFGTAGASRGCHDEIEVTMAALSCRGLATCSQFFISTGTLALGRDHRAAVVYARLALLLRCNKS